MKVKFVSLVIAVIATLMVWAQEPAFRINGPFTEEQAKAWKCTTADNLLNTDGYHGEIKLKEGTLQNPEKGITVQAIFRLDLEPHRSYFENTHDALLYTHKQFFLGFDNFRIYVNLFNGKDWFAPIMIPVNVGNYDWHAIAVTINRTNVVSQGDNYMTVTIYWDGKQVFAKRYDKATLPESTGELELLHSHNFGDVWHFGGQIETIEGYNRILGLDELEAFVLAHPRVKTPLMPKVKLTVKDEELLAALPQDSPEQISASNALNVMAHRNEKYDWKALAKALKSKKSLKKLGIHQYNLGSSLLTVLEGNGVAALLSWYDISAKREMLSSENPFYRIRVKDDTLVPINANYTSRFQELPTDKDGVRQFKISTDLGKIQADCVFRLLDDTISYKVTTTACDGLTKVEFPALEMEPLDADNANFFEPCMSGVVHPKIGKTSASVDSFYPRGIAAMQYGAYYDDKGGLFWSPEDAQARVKNIHVDAGANRLRIRYEWFPAEGEGFDPECGTRVALYRGNWYHAAMIYRRLLDEINAPWFYQGTMPRLDTPSWIRDNTLWLLHPRAFKDSVAKYGLLRKFVKMPFAVQMCWWNSKVWDRDYPNFRPLPEFSAMMDEWHAMGVHVTPYTNGRLWEKQDKRDEDWHYSSIGKPNCVLKADGKIASSTFNNKEFSIICPYTKAYEDAMHKCLKGLLEWNADGSYVDQVGAAMPFLCYDKSHGHKIPDDKSWFVYGHNKVFSKLKSELRTMDPEVILTTEDNAEVCMGLFEGNDTWRWMYRGQVQALAAVFNGRTHFVGMTYDQKEVPKVTYGKLAWMLSNSGQLGGFTLDFISHPKRHGERVWLSQLMQLRRAMLRFFNEGMMEPPPVFATAVAEEDLRWGDHGTGWVNTPELYSTAWSWKGNTAVMLMNICDKEYSNTLKCQAPKPNCQRWLLDSNGRSEKLPAAQDVTFTLLPHTAAVVLDVLPDDDSQIMLQEMRECQNAAVAAISTFDPFVEIDPKAPLARVDEKAEIIYVNTNAFTCRFYVGAMYPDDFRKPRHYNKLPDFLGGDKIELDGKTYRLSNDRWAEQKILENSSEKLVLECRGTFCGEKEDAAPGVKAKYIWTIFRNGKINAWADVEFPKDKVATAKALLLPFAPSAKSAFTRSIGEPMRNQNGHFVRKALFEYKPASEEEAMAAPAVPSSVNLTCGNVKMRLDSTKSWNINSIKVWDNLFCVDYSGAHYGMAYFPEGYKFAVGSGHHENYVYEIVKDMKLFVDGKKLDSIPTEASGKEIRFEKTSRINKFDVKYEFILKDDMLEEHTELTAVENENVAFLYTTMHPWATTFDLLRLKYSDGKTTDYTFKQDESDNPKSGFPHLASWYDSKKQMGVVTWLGFSPEVKNGRRAIWDRSMYHKDYAWSFTHSKFPAGLKAKYHARTAFFKASQDNWKAEADKIGESLIVK